MDIVVLFKIVQLAVLLVFGSFISDIRKKPGMVPLVSTKAILAMKLCYPIPICIYGYILVAQKGIVPSDLIAFVLISVGAAVIIRAKIDLGISHVWTGYYRKDTILIVNGIYRYMRHPLYTGIATVIIGGLFTIFTHSSWILITLVVGFVSYILGFLCIASMRETKALAQQYGEQFERYYKAVHPFLPLRRFTE